MAASRTNPPSRASTFAGQDSTSSTASIASRNAALLGASTAFGRSAPKGKAPVNTHSGANGALVGPFNAGIGSHRNSINMPPAAPLFPHSTGGSVRSNRVMPSNALATPSRPTSRLGLPPPSQSRHSRSPSQQAASLAAARAPSANTSPDNGTATVRGRGSHRPAVAPKPRRLSGYQIQDGGNDVEHPADLTSIAPTTSLVDLFERKASDTQTPNKRPEPIVIKPSQDLAIKSPKPVRTSGGITSLFQMELENKKSTPGITASDSEQVATKMIENKPPLAAKTSYGSRQKTEVGSNPPSSTVTRNSTMRNPTAPGSGPPMKRAPSTPSFRKMSAEAIDISERPPRTATTPLELFPKSPTTGTSIPRQFHQLYPPKVTPHMTGDQLANAMVAGNIATSRAPSPKKQEQPPPPPTRRPKHHPTFSFSRTPSPAKSGMLHTLRKTASESSDDEDDELLHPYGKHKKKRLVRKHPNKHHEGDRKRWRDAVTERERKRYEGVWAANKGLLCSLSKQEEITLQRNPSERAHAQEALADQISNIVARDIWTRSRLPNTTLEVVWDLVDGENVGKLGREEFVVGMWLIDQRLKGRKLPVRVSESVWASVRSLQGIKIRK